VAVMYGGKIQEVAEVNGLFASPSHPYTRGLLASLPRPDRVKQNRLQTIPGIVPSILDFPSGCKFWTRCTEKEEICEGVSAVLERVAGKDPDHTYVVIEEVSAENWGKGGKLFG